MNGLMYRWQIGICWGLGIKNPVLQVAIPGRVLGFENAISIIHLVHCCCYRSAKEEKSRTHGASRRNKNPYKKFRRKTTIKKNVKNSHSGMSESNIGANANNYAEGRATPELSDSHPDTCPEVNEVNSDDFANEQASPLAAAKEEEREASSDLEESDRRKWILLTEELQEIWMMNLLVCGRYQEQK
ncbi:uncharacterized protein LOC131255596 isoform X1 [Magnolia sinica]|uniref:uncharacterized protein LOC131255596 isoform X1 n=1 Tax=Magnolia sinica TaxID=86752 RepID=UPI002658E5C9|nr:uncharacterized protein LOC131255596 isoform X1 [Magnolia sinica]